MNCDQAKNVVMNVTEMESKVREATNDEPWYVEFKYYDFPLNETGGQGGEFYADAGYRTRVR
jgi:hypothetical protein